MIPIFSEIFKSFLVELCNHMPKKKRFFRYFTQKYFFRRQYDAKSCYFFVIIAQKEALRRCRKAGQNDKSGPKAHSRAGRRGHAPGAAVPPKGCRKKGVAARHFSGRSRPIGCGYPSFPATAASAKRLFTTLSCGAVCVSSPACVITVCSRSKLSSVRMGSVLYAPIS